MSYWVEITFYILASAIIAGLIVAVAALLAKVKRLSEEKAKLSLDNLALKEKLAEMLAGSDRRKLEETEGFVNFISQSRDWAFQYIEKVQIAIKNFQDIFHPFAVQYYEKKKTRITKDEFQTIVDAYKELVDRLPEEGKKK